MLNYIFEATLCWSIFYLVYYMFLQNETFFSINRQYLCGSLILGGIIPLLQFIDFNLQPTNELLEPISAGIYVVETNLEATILASASPFWAFVDILSIIYIIGVLIFSSRFLYGIWQMHLLAKQAEIIKNKNYTLLKTDQNHLPFSFFMYLFWSKKMVLNEIDAAKVHRHEMAHIRQWHSVDVLFLEVLQIIFWFNPLLYFYKKSIRDVHEYLADDYALQTTNTRDYGQLLIRQLNIGSGIGLANNFIYSQLKKRIIMMTKMKSKKRALFKYLWAAPLLLLMVLVFSNKKIQAQMQQMSKGQTANEWTIFKMDNFDEKAAKAAFEEAYIECQPINSETGEPIEGSFLRNQKISAVHNVYKALLEKFPESTTTIENLFVEFFKTVNVKVSKADASDFRYYIEEEEKVLAEVDEMPRFPGCEDLSLVERKQCADKKLLEFIYSKINYPKAAKEAGVQGRVVISFVVEKDGSLNEIELVRDPGSGLGEEALRVVNLMSEMPEKWIPGKQDGNIVRTAFNLPVSFRLSEEEKEEAYQVVDEIPRFPGCENIIDQEERQNCSEQKMLEFVYSNVKYPEIARKNGVEGNAMIYFVIEKDGRISDAKVVRDPGSGLGEEALRVVTLMNEMEEAWIPGKLLGEKVRVQFHLPIGFRINKEEAKLDKKLSFETFKLYPNPAIDQITINFKGEDAPTSIRIIGVDGQQHMELKEESGNFKKTIDMTGKTGMFTVIIEQNGKIKSKNIVVQ